MSSDTTIDFTAVRKGVDQKIREHRRVRALDSLLWNGGTIAVLLATWVATILPEELGFWIRLPTAFAGFWVAVERILNFGGRWNFHRRMLNGYEAVRTKIDFCEVVPQEEREQYRREIMKRLDLLSEMESDIPGATLVSAQIQRQP
jgi:hypothetical protein